jgi:hypothetical protein
MEWTQSPRQNGKMKAFLEAAGIGPPVRAAWPADPALQEDIEWRMYPQPFPNEVLLDGLRYALLELEENVAAHVEHGSFTIGGQTKETVQVLRCLNDGDGVSPAMEECPICFEYSGNGAERWRIKLMIGDFEREFNKEPGA